MLQFLLNNSITIIFLITASFLAYDQSKKYMERKQMNPQEFRSLLRLKLNEAGNQILAKAATSAFIALVISMVSFRELWINDVFHIVFLTSLLLDKVQNAASNLFE